MSTLTLPLLPSTSDLLEYYCVLTSEIKKHISTLVACQKTVERLDPLPQLEFSLRQESLLQSSLFSARIEGNPLTLSDLTPVARMSTTTQRSTPHSHHRREVTNLNRAYEWVLQLPPSTPLTTELLRQLHTKTMQGLSAEVGTIRSEESAIFNQVGVAVYLTPSPQQIRPQLSDLCQWVTTNRTENTYPPVVMAVMAHKIFEKIHPFLDGNGRVGRLLLFFLLNQAGLSIRGLLVVERVLAERRQEYYDQLSPTTANCTPWVEFMTECLAAAAQTTVRQLEQPVPSTAPALPTDLLLPRRQEILNTIRDHRLVSFDFLSRRFLTVKPSTLHYDLKCLLDQGLVSKVGKTRGALYTLKS